ncbi:MAG: DUF1186 domain-containing protein [Chloroflexi bacterium]|nr:DUF1186 domain-containing protein [Chloroflexota bacterium]
MVNLFKRGPASDRAAKRYPEALADLLTLGKPAEDATYDGWAARLKDHALDLIRMVLDDDLNARKEKDPAVWAPLHALRTLGVLGPAEAAEPLLACLAWDDEWGRTVLPEVYAGIGAPAVPLLQDYLADASRNEWARIYAADCLAAIAKAHADVKDEIVAFLTAFLDRSAADANQVEEAVTTFAIYNLAHLGARSAYDAIKRAYAENRVDPQVIGLDDVEVDLGMRPAPDYDAAPKPPDEPGVRLSLRCKACGRERSYLFPKVYCDLGTVRRKEESPKYNPIIIPQRVVCQKCGAVDQYEIGGMGQVALLADLLMKVEPELEKLRRPDQRVQYTEFTTRWGSMHPLAAIERYEREIARYPNDSSLHVGFGQVLRFLGRGDEAEAEQRKALELDPVNPEAWVNLAQMAAERGAVAEARELWQKVLALGLDSRLPVDQRELLTAAAREALDDLRHGRKIEVMGPPLVHGAAARAALAGAPRATRRQPARPPVAPPASPPPVAATMRSAPKVGRNEPCPCGSGKKYKHCHGRPGQQPR